MAKTYVEVLADGLTLGGAVRRAGDAVAVDDLEPQSKKDQVERWGEPRYRKISQKEFEERGGVEGESLGAFAAEATAAEEEPASGGAPEDEFAGLEDENVDETLSAVAEFDDETTARFIKWEQENANRKGVLEPLGAWTE